MKAIDYIVLAIIAAAFIGIVIFIYRQRKANKNCSSGCGGCPFASRCSSPKIKKVSIK